MRLHLVLAFFLLVSSGAYAAARPGTIVPKPSEEVPLGASVVLRRIPTTIEIERSAERPEFGRPLMPIPEELPVPDWVPRKKPQPIPERQLIEHAALIPSPAPSASFLALDDNGTYIPPDTHGAVGPTHLMTTLNTQFRIQSRAGNGIVTGSLKAFWSSVRAGIDPFDPRILYDPTSGRWIFVSAADDSSATSTVLVGVSETGDPTARWFLYQIDADPVDRTWADFPSVGFNSSLLCIQVNMYENCGESNCSDGVDNDSDGSVDEQPFDRSQVLVIDKNTLYAGANVTLRRIDVVDFGGSQVPAMTFDSGAPIYLLQSWNGNASGNGFLRLYMITGARGAETLTPTAYPSSPNTWDSQSPNGADFAPQLGSTHKIQTNTSRIHSVIYRNGSIWGAQTVFLPAGGFPTRSAIQWWEISTAGDARQRGLIDDPSGASFVAFPSIAVNRAGDALVGYSRFRGSEYASASYSFRASIDPPGALRSDSVLKPGEASYYRPVRGRNRWGDYSATSVDPLNDTDFWTIQEYAAVPRSGLDRWGTWWGQIRPEGAAPAVCSSGTTNLCLNNGRFRVTLDWTTTGGQGVGMAIPKTADTGLFWFFSPNNVEAVIKVVNGCSFNSRYWVFAAGLTNVAVTITVSDTQNGAVRTYTNRQGTAFQPIQDTAAFANCP